LKSIESFCWLIWRFKPPRPFIKGRGFHLGKIFLQSEFFGLVGF
jgi:hypothetical protein